MINEDIKQLEILIRLATSIILKDASHANKEIWMQSIEAINIKETESSMPNAFY